MTERDYTAWLTVRIIGEAVTRTSSADPQTIRDYLRSDAFQIAAFKGEALSFRTWDQQLRQPILIVGPRMLVSVSPQAGLPAPAHAARHDGLRRAGIELPSRMSAGRRMASSRSGRGPADTRAEA